MKALHPTPESLSDLYRLYLPSEAGKDGAPGSSKGGIQLIGDDLILCGVGAQVRQRFEAFVIRDPDPCGCWLWGGSLRPDGYGQFSLVKGITWRAHRVGYLLRHGGLPDGLVLDHLCRVRQCVNPDHLEPVTLAENTRRGNAGKTGPTCRKGHLRTEGNTYRKGTHHECRACHRDRERRRKERIRHP